MTTDTNKPIARVRLGYLEAAIWLNEQDGRRWYSFRIDRSFKDQDEWKNTSTFKRDDALTLMELGRLTYHRIRELEQADKDAAKASDEAA